MKCLFCKQGETRPGRVTVMLQRGEALVIFKGVPGDVCENCGEYFLSGDVTGELLDRAEEAIRKGAEVEILRFAALIPPDSNPEHVRACACPDPSAMG